MFSALFSKGHINFETFQMMETLTCTWEKNQSGNVKFHFVIIKSALEIVKVNKIKSRLNETIVFLMTGSCAIAGQKQSLLKHTAKWQMANENNLGD